MRSSLCLDRTEAYWSLTGSFYWVDTEDSGKLRSTRGPTRLEVRPARIVKIAAGVSVFGQRLLSIVNVKRVSYNVSDRHLGILGFLSNSGWGNDVTKCFKKCKGGDSSTMWMDMLTWSAVGCVLNHPEGLWLWGRACGSAGISDHSQSVSTAETTRGKPDRWISSEFCCCVGHDSEGTYVESTRLAWAQVNNTYQQLHKWKKASAFTLGFVLCASYC